MRSFTCISLLDMHLKNTPNMCTSCSRPCTASSRVDTVGISDFFTSSWMSLALLNAKLTTPYFTGMQWMVMSLHSVQHPFTPFYDTPYIYSDTIWPSLQIRSTLTLSNGLLLLSLLSQHCQQLTHDHVWVSPIATPMDKPQNDGHPLWSLSLSLLNTMRKHCDQFVIPFTLFSDKLCLVQSRSS